MAIQKEKLIAEALKLVEKAQYDRAIKVYLKVVAEDDKDVRVWLSIGDLYTKLRRNGEAAETYQRVAQFYNDQGFYKKAVAVYKQILKLDPSLVSVDERLADLYKQMGILPDAIEHYAAVAAHHQKQGDVRAALAALKQIVELDPQNVAPRVKLAEMYSKEQMNREAIDEFAKAAEHLHEQGRFDDYLKVAERLLFHSPENRPVSRELARLYLRKNDARRALPRLQVCFKADPRDVETLSLLADAFEALGQNVKAVSVLKELGRVHGENGSTEEVKKVFNRVQRLAPDDTDVRRALRPRTQPSLQSQPGLGALRNLRPATADLPADTDADPTRLGHKSGGATAPAGGAPPASGPSLRRAATEAPATPPSQAVELDEAEVERTLAETDVFMKYSLHAKAVEHVKAVLERAPAHVAAREKLKSIYVTLGRTAEAAEELRALSEQSAGEASEADYLTELLSLLPDDEWAVGRLGHLSHVGPAGATTGHGEAGVERSASEHSNSVDVPLEFVEEEPSDGTLGGPAGAPALDGAEDLDLDADENTNEVDLDDLDFTEEPPSVTSGVAEHKLTAPPSLPASASASEFASGSAAGSAAGSIEDEFPLVVETSHFSAPALPPVDEEIEDRFGADLDEQVTGVELRAASVQPDDAAEPKDPTDEVAQGRLVDLPSPDDVENFDFANFNEDLDAPVALGAEPRRAAAAVGGDETVATSPARGTGESPPSAALDDELDEADFYLQQGLIDDAKNALGALLARYPGHPLVLGKLRELDDSDAKVEAPRAPQARQAPAAANVSSVPLSAPSRALNAIALDAEGFERLRERSAPGASGASRGEASARRHVVEKGVNDDDFASHFDLGIGYKEMGLIDNAIAEFRLVMRDPTRQVQCHQMLGLCFAAKGLMSDAITHFKHGLYAEGIQEDEEFSLYYELGLAYEKIGDTAEAAYYYERIFKRKPRYRDVDRRLKHLAAGTSAGLPADQVNNK